MKLRRTRLLSILLAVTLILGGVGFSSAASGKSLATPAAPQATADQSVMADLVRVLGQNIDGERAFDYLSYVYMGWRTTGGKWQNQVIENFIYDQLDQAGYVPAGVATSPNTNTKSSNDKSSDHSKDYTWVTDYNISSDTWDPEYAKLEVVSAPNVSGKSGLIKRINVEAPGFDPTSPTYIQYYDDLYGGINNIDDMWAWITKKNSKGQRVNVLNGEEAKLNQRCHLATNSCFTDPKGTDPSLATGVTGAVEYVGTISGSGNNRYCTKYPDAASSNANLNGKAILCDSSLSTAFSFAQQVGAIAVMSTNSLNNYSTPKDEEGNIISPFDKSARFAGGASLSIAKTQTATGRPIVEWQFSNDQKTALKELLQKAEGVGPVIVKNVSIGDVYAMNDATKGGKGQAVAMAEIKGATKPDERILICAHVQEPGSNDNATGCGALLEMATKLKKMIQQNKIQRPDRTITFLWGDEMNLATFWLNSHPDEKTKLVAALDMDMVGEDPAKTGGVMRIEKTPDPSANYNYTLDELPWENNPSYDATFKDGSGKFVRLPDSHTLWGAGSTNGLFDTGFYLNDLYMSAAQAVIANHDSGFQVDVCPYEGGSDHSRFLAQNVPALLTWHFTDYTYHSSVDTLNMSSARELENVDITTLATAFMMANTTDSNEFIAKEILKGTYDAAVQRLETEKANTNNHLTYILGNNKNFDTELDNEKEVLNVWGSWYKVALQSVASSLLTTPSAEYAALEAQYVAALEAKTAEAVAYAEKEVQPMVTVSFETAGGNVLADMQIKRGPAGQQLPAATRTGYTFDGWYLSGAAVTAATIIPGDVTLVAKWTAIPVVPVQPPKQNETAKVDISSFAASAIADQIYSGKAITPAVTIKDGGAVLRAGTDYIASYANNVGIGKATVTITGKGSYAGTKTLSFRIIPKTSAISKVKAEKGALTVTWQKVARVDKYQIRYKVSGNKTWKVKTVSSKNASLTIKSLKKGKKYQLQICSYKTVGKVKYYSAWSEVKKSAKIK